MTGHSIEELLSQLTLEGSDANSKASKEQSGLDPNKYHSPDEINDPHDPRRAFGGSYTPTSILPQASSSGGSNKGFKIDKPGVTVISVPAKGGARRYELDMSLISAADSAEARKVSAEAPEDRQQDVEMAYLVAVSEKRRKNPELQRQSKEKRAVAPTPVHHEDVEEETPPSPRQLMRPSRHSRARVEPASPSTSYDLVIEPPRPLSTRFRVRVADLIVTEEADRGHLILVHDSEMETASMMPMPLDDETVAELEQRLEVGDIDEEYFKDHVTWYVYVKAHKLHQTPERVFAVVPTDVNFAHNGFEYCVTSVREVTVVDPKKQTAQPR